MNSRAFPVELDTGWDKPDVWQVWSPWHYPHYTGRYATEGAAQARADRLNRAGQALIDCLGPDFPHTFGKLLRMATCSLALAEALTMEDLAQRAEAAMSASQPVPGELPEETARYAHLACRELVEWFDESERTGSPARFSELHATVALARAAITKTEPGLLNDYEIPVD